jgi:plastocyanin
MRRGMPVVAALLAALATAPAALADDQTVQAVDGTAADNYNNRWTPSNVTVKAGETVTWSFAGTGVFHNVASNSSNWSFRNGDPAIAPPPGSFTFTTPGVYGFVCQIHATTMTGTVTVTDATGTPPPPPPPPPPSEQPWPNDQQAPTVFEVADEQRPKLSGVRASGIAHGARVRFRLSEVGRATITAQRGRRTIEAKRVRARKGANSVMLRGLRAGRYDIAVRARDLAGNRSRPRHVRLTISG